MITDSAHTHSTEQAPHESTDQAQIETFHFLHWGFDITALRALLTRVRSQPAHIGVPVAAAARMMESDPQTTVPAQRHVPLVGVEVDWANVDALPAEALTSPVFVAPLGDLGEIVIDGWHRIALARRMGIPELPGLLITRRQATRVLLPGSRQLPR